MSKEQTPIEELKAKATDNADMFHKQNLNGREDFIEAFEKGIEAGVEEAFELFEQLLTKEKEQIEELKEYIEKIANHPSVYDSEIANEGLKLIGKENL